MHLIGTWHSRPRRDPTTSGTFSFLKLRISDAVTVFENRCHKLAYEGIIFDATGEQLLNDPTLLDRAFGYYTYVLFEKATGTIYLGTDRLGFSPVYYTREDETFQFSSSLTLLKYELNAVTPNFDAWDEQHTIGDILGEKTLIKEIRRLRWGRKFRITADQIDTVDIWEPDVPAFTDKRTYIRANNDLLIEALKLTRSCAWRKVVMLSGGDDSRRLAISAHHIGLPITCATQEIVGKGGVDDDVLIAETVSRSLGLSSIRVALSSTRDALRDAMIEDYWLGYEAGQHAWVLPLMRSLPRALVYDGIAGDVIVNGHFFHTYPELLTRFRDLDYAAQLICGTGQSGVDQKLLSAPLFERVRAEFARYPDSPHRLTYYYLLNHTRRSIGGWFALFYVFGHLPALPYLYYPFFIQSLSLDPHHYVQTWMQNECIKEMNLMAAAIPTTRNKVPADFIIDRKFEARSRSQFAARHARIRPDVATLLPGLVRTRRTHQSLSLLGLHGYADRWDWAPVSLGRLSQFLDWIEDRQAPEFPVKRETTAFLERHFVDSDRVPPGS